MYFILLKFVEEKSFLLYYFGSRFTTTDYSVSSTAKHRDEN